MKKKVKLIAIVVLLVLAVIIFLQNRQVTETRILLARVEMSLALLLILTFVLGFVTGLLAMTRSLSRRKA